MYGAWAGVILGVMTNCLTLHGPELPFERLCRMNALQLAYAGDTVYDLYVRTRLLCVSDAKVHALHKSASGYVCAHAQSEALSRVEGMLTDQERDIVRRGRNAKSHSVPKNADPGDYSRATALEALVGYLYLSGKEERLEEIMKAALMPEGETTCQGRR